MLNRELFREYEKSFLKQNAVVNLISKNDEKYLFEKHIFDSLSISDIIKRKISETSKTLTMLDIGTGGGFPALPAAVAFPEIQVFALDSIAKKIRAIDNIKSDLGLKNLNTICARVETIDEQFDIVTCRAVAPLKVILEYAVPHMMSDGIFVAYKSVKVDEEIEDAKQTLKKLKCEISEILEYKLPLKENYTRNLVIVKKI